jgi:hypothetical protein
MLGGRGPEVRLVPDYDYTLLFPAAARGAVIEGLGRLCDEASRAGLEAVRGRVGTVEADLAIRSLPDMPAEVVLEFRELPDGTHALGSIYLTIGPSGSVEFPDAVEFRLWPCTRRLQRACLGSMLLRNELVRLLEGHRGHAGYVVNESCDPVEFWHESAGRLNDGHPAEYMAEGAARPCAGPDRGGQSSDT